MMDDIKIINKYTGMIPDHFLENDEMVLASSEKEAEIIMIQNLRKKLMSMTDKELVEYLGLLIFEQE
jgi:hypothetical protein